MFLHISENIYSKISITKYIFSQNIWFFFLNIIHGTTNVTLCTLTVRGDATGETNLTIIPTKIDDDIGGRYRRAVCTRGSRCNPGCREPANDYFGEYVGYAQDYIYANRK